MVRQIGEKVKVVAEYNFNHGREFIAEHYPDESAEIISVITMVDASLCKNKESEEKTMVGKMLFSPRELNAVFKEKFNAIGWSHYKVDCDYVYGEYLEGYIPPQEVNSRPFRDMDFLKPTKKLGIEVQFGKYAFMVYNVCAKMTIFKNLGVIDCGIEIVPVKRFADEMSTGVSYFEQFAWDLHNRGISNIDVPVLIFGIDS
jgi:hypothetical protein